MTKKRVLEIIQIGCENDRASMLYDRFIAVTILINISILILETFDSLIQYSDVMKIVEDVTYVILIVEYILNIWTADIKYPDLGALKSRGKFLISYDGVVELLTIMPFFFLNGVIVFQMLRIVRILHLFRINAAYDSFNAITSVLKSRKNQLLSSLVIIMTLITAASLCMYSVEHPVQPDVFKNAFSGIWWAVSTIFTVGYGDMYPVTMLGRFIAVIITFLGVGAVAIPTGIISAGFVEEYNEMQRAGRGGTITRNSSIYVDEFSLYKNKRIAEFYKEFGISPSVIVREGEVIIPMPNTIVREGDTLVYQCNIEEDY